MTAIDLLLVVWGSLGTVTSLIMRQKLIEAERRLTAIHADNRRPTREPA